MNLAQYREAVASRRANGDFIRFEKDGETRLLRFMYDDLNKEGIVKYKAWNDTEKKYEYSDTKDSSDYKPTIRMNCIQYDEDGSNPRKVVWEFSAYIVDRDLVPQLENIKPHNTGVWKVQVNNPGEMNIKIVAFPVIGADTVKFPIDLPDAEEVKETKEAKEKPKPKASASTQATETVEASKKTGKYW